MYCKCGARISNISYKQYKTKDESGKTTIVKTNELEDLCSKCLNIATGNDDYIEDIDYMELGIDIPEKDYD